MSELHEKIKKYSFPAWLARNDDEEVIPLKKVPEIINICVDAISERIKKYSDTYKIEELKLDEIISINESLKLPQDDK